jgi:hypothetical protein
VGGVGVVPDGWSHCHHYSGVVLQLTLTSVTGRLTTRGPSSTLVRANLELEAQHIPTQSQNERMAGGPEQVQHRLVSAST